MFNKVVIQVHAVPSTVPLVEKNRLAMSSTRSCSPFSVRALTLWVVQIVLAIVGVTRGSECAPFNSTINGYDCEALSTSFNFSNATLASNTTYLNVDRNNIPEITPQMFESATLTELSMEHNALTSLPQCVFGWIPTLRGLDLSDNTVVLGHGMFCSHSSGLRELDFTGNRITHIPTGMFVNLTSLTTLGLSYNRIHRVLDGMFTGLHSLEVLRLVGNSLTLIEDGTFSDLTSLVELYLETNSLTMITRGSFATQTSLRYLFLFDNCLRIVEKGAFSNLTSVVVLDMSGNPMIFNTVNGTSERNLFRRVVFNGNGVVPSGCAQTRSQGGCHLSHFRDDGTNYCCNANAISPTSCRPDLPSQVNVNELSPLELTVARAASSLRDIVNETTFTGLGPSTRKFSSVVFFPPTAKFYLAPFNDPAVLVVNTRDGTMDNTTLAGLGNGGSKWIGMAVAGDRVFATPYSADSVLIISPHSNTTDTNTLGGLGTQARKWLGMASASIRGVVRLFCAPFNADTVLVVNPATNTTDTTTFAGLGNGTAKWGTIAFAPNVNKLYCPPGLSSSVLIVDPVHNVTDTTTLGGLNSPSGSIKWQGIVYIASLGQLFANPISTGPTGDLLVIDPVVNTTTRVPLLPGGSSQFAGFVYSEFTRIVSAAPNNIDAVLRVNPFTRTADASALRVSSGRGNFHDIAIDNQTGDLVAAPHNADYVLFVRTVFDGYCTSATNETSLRTATRRERAFATINDATFGNYVHMLHNTELLGTQNRSMYGGSAVDPITGKVYSAPMDADSILVVDDHLSTFDTTTLGGFGLGDAKWSDLAFDPVTGHAFAAPYNAEAVLIINPRHAATDTTELGGLGRTEAKWSGIVYVPETRKFMCSPYDSNTVLMIDPLMNLTDTSAFGNIGTAPAKFSGLAYASVNGRVYCAPDSHHAVLVLDPETNTSTTLSVPASPSSGAAYSGITYAGATRKLYCAPLNADAVLVIDPVTGSLDVLALAGLGHGGYKFGRFGYNGISQKLQAPPRQGRSILEVDPLNNASTVVGLGCFHHVSVAGAGYSGLVFVPITGSMVGVPERAGRILIVEPTVATTVLDDMRRRLSIASLTEDERAVVERNSSLVQVSNDTASYPIQPALPGLFLGAVYAPNVRKVFFCPLNSDSVLILDPATGVMDATTMSGVGFQRGKYTTGTFVPTTGTIFMVPFNVRSVLFVSPQTNMTSAIPLLSPVDARYNWHGSTFAENVGKVFGTPADAPAVLIIDPHSHATDVTTLSGLGFADNKWLGMAYDPSTGLLACAPHSADGVLIIDPVGNSTDTTALSGLGTAQNKWRDIFWDSITGKLYCSPGTADSVLIVDLIALSYDNSSLSGLGSGSTIKFNGISSIPTTGKLVAIPHDSDFVLIIDTVTGSMDTSTLRGLYPTIQGPKFNIPVSIPEQDIVVAAPFTTDSLLVIDTFIDEDVVAPFREPPVALAFPGNTPSVYSIVRDYEFPPLPFTITARVKIASSSPVQGYIASYAVGYDGDANCWVLHSNDIGVRDVWVHYAVTFVDADQRTAHQFINGVRTSRNASYCGVRRGVLVWGQDQDHIGHPFTFSAAQAATFQMDSFAVYPVALSPAQIQRAADGDESGLVAWNRWCVPTTANPGIDIGLQKRDMEFYGVSGRQTNLSTELNFVADSVSVVPGVSRCVDNTSQLAAVHLPGFSISSYAISENFTLPPVPFTIEGRVRVTAASRHGRFWLSYGLNCLILTTSPFPVYDEFVHVAVVVNSTSERVQQYFNGVLSTTTVPYCGAQRGGLILGNDLDSVDGDFDEYQAPEMSIDFLAVHRTALTQSQIDTISTGGTVNTAYWTKYCFSDPDNMGYDSGFMAQHLRFNGSSIVAGVSNCGVVVPQIQEPTAQPTDTQTAFTTAPSVAPGAGAQVTGASGGADGIGILAGAVSAAVVVTAIVMYIVMRRRPSEQTRQCLSPNSLYDDATNDGQPTYDVPNNGGLGGFGHSQDPSSSISTPPTPISTTELDEQQYVAIESNNEVPT